MSSFRYGRFIATIAFVNPMVSVLKRVVKLATPAVVHIEARRDNDGVRPAKGESEEAGSGVIIERGSFSFAQWGPAVVSPCQRTS